MVDGQIALLRDGGLEVETYFRSSDEIAELSGLAKLEVAVRPVYSREAVADLDAIITKFRPDVVHLHNVYPLISPAVVTRAKSRGCGVVQTVHNFRHICASGSLFRDSVTCTECLGKRVPFPAVVHGCYRGSRAQSVVMGTSLAYHHRTWRRADRFLAVSEFVAGLLATTGISPEQICVVPNSVRDPGPPAPLGTGFLFVGRLDDQKGISLLLDAWERTGLGRVTELTIVGDGPERARVERAAQQLDGIRYLGPVAAEAVLPHMRNAQCVVIPPIGYEALPTVVLEAFAAGRPVVATKVGPLESLVPADAGWLAAADPAQLACALNDSWNDTEQAAKGRRARELYESRYAPDAVRATLVGVYEEVCMLVENQA